jgi:glycosyltransferase involved in cell wall biosynthesis
MAYIISKITQIPWSFTLHRWDLYQNNILIEKVKSASFVRCISKKAKMDLVKIVSSKYEQKIQVIHLGVNVPSLDRSLIINRYASWGESKSNFNIVVPASLISVKGHQFLIEALALLLRRKIRNFKCTFYGDGPLKEKLRELIIERKLTKRIVINGHEIPHEELMQLYRGGKVDLVLLPSVITEDGDFEGIPVSLMEAMSYAIPVISTNTGSIPELISNKTGILVDPENPRELANAILYLMRQKSLAKNLGLGGRKTIEINFSSLKTSQILFKRIEEAKNSFMI